MVYTTYYDSPLGSILLSADEKGMTGLWFVGQKYFARGLDISEANEKNRADVCSAETFPLLAEAEHWLDIYFSGNEPDFNLPMHPAGTEFQKRVWELLCRIPYGKTVTYGQLASQLAAEQGRKRMSAQAVGGAVGHNPLSILVPCHRVVGANGSLTGYAGGIDRKIRLLTLEGTDMSSLFF